MAEEEAEEVIAEEEEVIAEVVATAAAPVTPVRTGCALRYITDQSPSASTRMSSTTWSLSWCRSGGIAATAVEATAAAVEAMVEEDMAATAVLWDTIDKVGILVVILPSPLRTMFCGSKTVLKGWYNK